MTRWAMLDGAMWMPPDGEEPHDWAARQLPLDKDGKSVLRPQQSEAVRAMTLSPGRELDWAPESSRPPGTGLTRRVETERQQSPAQSLGLGALCSGSGRAAPARYFQLVLATVGSIVATCGIGKSRMIVGLQKSLAEAAACTVFVPNCLLIGQMAKDFCDAYGVDDPAEIPDFEIVPRANCAARSVHIAECAAPRCTIGVSQRSSLSSFVI